MANLLLLLSVGLIAVSLQRLHAEFHEENFDRIQSFIGKPENYDTISTNDNDENTNFNNNDNNGGQRSRRSGDTHWYFFNPASVGILSFMSPRGNQNPVARVARENAESWQFLVISENPWVGQIQTIGGSYCLRGKVNGDVLLAACQLNDASQKWNGQNNGGLTMYQNVATKQYLDAGASDRDVRTRATNADVRAYQQWKVGGDKSKLT